MGCGSSAQADPSAATNAQSPFTGLGDSDSQKDATTVAGLQVAADTQGPGSTVQPRAEEEAARKTEEERIAAVNAKPESGTEETPEGLGCPGLQQVAADIQGPGSVVQPRAEEEAARKTEEERIAAANAKPESGTEETPEDLVCPRFSPSSDNLKQSLHPEIATATALLAGGDATSTKRALFTAAAELHKKLLGVADLVICTCTCQHRAADVLAAAAELFDGIPFAANTSHGGLATDEHNARVQHPSPTATSFKRPAVLGLWAIRDEKGAYAVASAKVEGKDDEAHKTAGREAFRQAREDVDELAPVPEQSHALGLKWRNVGPTEPASGQELDNPQLSEALDKKTEFTQQEWDGFRIVNLRMDHFVKRGDDYFKPAESHEARRRRHEMLMWMYTAPGCEEEAVSGATDCLSKDSVLLGSTSADDRLEGLWWQLAKPTNKSGRNGRDREPEAFCGHGWQSKGVAISEGVVAICMRPSFEFTPVYSHGYAPSIHSAVVEENGDKDGKPDQRVLKTLRPLIHGQRTSAAEPVPAAELYDRWTGGHFQEQLEKAKDGPTPKEDPEWGVDILKPGSYFPLGLEGVEAVNSLSRQKTGACEEEEEELVERRIAGLDQFGNQPAVLLHPAFIKQDFSLQVFSRAPPGSIVRLLVGTAQSLVNNISVVSNSLDERAPFAREHVLGSLFFFCGGTMDCVVNDQTIEASGAGDDAETQRGTAVAEAFSAATSDKPFMMSHPFGEQCKQIGWERGLHANLMFGGAVFGKAAFGLARPAQLFISYCWGKQVVSQEAGQSPGQQFETQLLVTKLKTDLEKSLRLTCWLDTERMGAGCSIDKEMEDGVKDAHVFICCLTDAYLGSSNCLKEFKAAANSDKLIVPLLLPGYVYGMSEGQAEVDPPSTSPALKWEISGTEKPTQGRELSNKKLAAALLKGQKEFTQKAWKDFGISDLCPGDFIKAEDSYFKSAVRTPWPPSSSLEPLVSLTLGKDQRLYVDMRTEENRECYFQQIVNQIDAHVRKQRAQKHWHKAKVGAISTSAAS